MRGGTQTTNERQRALAERQAITLERKYRPVLKGVFNRTNAMAAQGYQDNGWMGVNAAMAAQAQSLLVVMPPMYTETAAKTARQFRRLHAEAFKAYDAVLVTKNEQDVQEVSPMFTEGPTEILQDPNLRRWWVQEMEPIIAERVQGITNTSRSIIEVIVEDSANKGLSTRETALSIMDRTTGRYSFNRAELIAQTEIHGAQMATNQASVQSLVDDVDLKVVKEWVAAADDRTRINHQVANGQRVEMDGLFQVGPDAMRYPGDQNASPANRCRCRCAMVYHTVDPVSGELL